MLNGIDVFMNSIFALNIAVTFFSSYYDEDYELVVRHKVIALEYLSTWFLFDVASITPFGLITSKGVITRLTRLGKIGKLLKIIRLTRMIRLVRLVYEKNRIMKYVYNTLKIGIAV